VLEELARAGVFANMYIHEGAGSSVFAGFDESISNVHFTIPYASILFVFVSAMAVLVIISLVLFIGAGLY